MVHFPACSLDLLLERSGAKISYSLLYWQ
jgi:hypothetical protein